MNHPHENQQNDAEGRVAPAHQDHYSPPVVSEAERDEDEDSDEEQNAAIANHDSEDGGYPPSAETAEFYGRDLDDQDEAWVYKHLRGGVEEPLTVLRSNNPQQAQSQQQQQSYNLAMIRALKPRNSDAVLSCPCCLQIVCMDCQQHIKFENQFRAMFVMGIDVDWNKKLVLDETNGLLVEKQAISMAKSEEGSVVPTVPNDVDHHYEEESEEEEYYYSVHCANCKTQVAALDMRDEVYHFFGCIASA
jgi:hypothetical protein